MRRDKPWFGPGPISPITGLRGPLFPRTWQGVVVMLAFFPGMLLLTKWAHDPTRAGIAALLWIAAFVAIIFLTWSSDPD